MRVASFGQCAIWTLASIQSAAAFWRMACDNPLVFERLDPIINPGALSSHVHNVAGGSSFGPSATYDSMQTSSCTSCPIVEDLSAYWTPELYYQYQNGSFISVPNGGTTVYYLQRNSSVNERVHAFPEGFRMISGNPNLRSYNGNSRAQQAINYVCLNYAGTSTYTNELPTTNCPDGLRLQIVFPSCWDGVNLDSADHKSHVSFPTSISAGTCDDPNFPVRLITIFYEVFYDSGDFSNMWYGTGQPFVLANGDPTGYGLHGDFLNGWNVTTLQNAADTCTNDSGHIEDCPAFTIKHPSSSAAQCHKSPSVNEVVINTVLDKLPGCNPITPGPANATPGTCTNLTTPTIWANTTGYYGNIVPPGYHDLSGVSTVQTYKNWNSIGCYADTNARIFPVRYLPSPATIEMCLDTCQSNGYTYGGMEYASECWCGKTMGNANLTSYEACNMPCAGNSSEWCGGSLTLTTYALDTAIQSNAVSSSRSSAVSSSTTSASPSALSSPSVVNWSLVGCYTDSYTRTIRYATTANATVEACQAACQAKGYTVAGLENWTECYCDNSIQSTGSLAPSTDCNYPCDKNHNEMCGGAWRLSVYSATVGAKAVGVSSASSSSSSISPSSSIGSSSSITSSSSSSSIVSKSSSSLAKTSSVAAGVVVAAARPAVATTSAATVVAGRPVAATSVKSSSSTLASSSKLSSSSSSSFKSSSTFKGTTSQSSTVKSSSTQTSSSSVLSKSSLTSITQISSSSSAKPSSSSLTMSSSSQTTSRSSTLSSSSSSLSSSSGTSSTSRSSSSSISRSSSSGKSSSTTLTSSQSPIAAVARARPAFATSSPSP